MAPEVENNIDKIIQACKEMQLKSLYIFGSGARKNNYSKTSDLDFLYTMKTDDNGMLLTEYDYFDLMKKLEEITGKKVDLVAEKKIRNQYFLQTVLKDRIKLYES